MNAHAAERDAIDVTSLTPIDADRAVAHVTVGPFHIGSLWINGRAKGRPVVSWPKTTRGYPILDVEAPLKGKIEQVTLAALEARGP
jgi:hypothetical protein